MARQPTISKKCSKSSVNHSDGKPVRRTYAGKKICYGDLLRRAHLIFSPRVLSAESSAVFSWKPFSVGALKGIFVNGHLFLWRILSLQRLFIGSVTNISAVGHFLWRDELFSLDIYIPFSLTRVHIKPESFIVVADLVADPSTPTKRILSLTHSVTGGRLSVAARSRDKKGAWFHDGSAQPPSHRPPALAGRAR